MTIDLDDDDVGGKVDFVREGAGTDAGDGDAALDAELGGDGGGDGLLGDAELVLTDVPGVRTAGRLGAVAEVGEELGAVRDADIECERLAATQDAETHGGTGLLVGDDADELITILDGLAIDGGNDVLGLDASLGRGAVGRDGGDQNTAVGEAIDAADSQPPARPGTGCRWSRG